LEDLLLGAFGGAAEQLGNSNGRHLQITTWASGVERFVSTDFREYPIYPLLMLHQVIICFVLIHGIFTNHEIHSSLNLKHKVVGTLAVSQLTAKLQEGNFLRCPVDVEDNNFSRSPTVRNRPNFGSGKLLNNVATTKDGARKVECIFTAPDPSCPMVVGRSANNS
jgi:hypothetical protein